MLEKTEKIVGLWFDWGNQFPDWHYGEFSQKSHFLKNVSRFKRRYKKITRFMQCIVQVGIRLCKKFFWKMSNIQAIIEYFPFLNWYNLTFSQIEIIIKFLKNFVKEGLKYWNIVASFLHSINICKNKKNNNLWNMWNKMYWSIILISK